MLSHQCVKIVKTKKRSISEVCFNMDKPMVSVVVPCYNCEKYIEETINSILNQTFSNFEILVVDDLSTDNTECILEKLRKKDKRIKYFKLLKKGGATGARNKALREAKGKYIAFLDGDDLWKPEKLEKQVKFMEDNNIYFSYTDYEYIDEKSKRLNRMRKCPFKMSYLNVTWRFCRLFDSDL